MPDSVATKDVLRELEARLDGGIDKLEEQLNGRIDKEAERNDGRFQLSCGMVGFTLAIEAAILIKPFAG